MTHYKTLGLTKGFTVTQLKTRWRQLSSTMHPDRLGGTAEANSAFAAVTNAYAVLSSPARKVLYDKELEILSTPCEDCNGAGEVFKQRSFTGRTSSACKRCDGCGRIFNQAKKKA